MQEQLGQLKIYFMVFFIWRVPSFGFECTVVTAAAESLGEGRGGLVPEFVSAHARCEREHESRGCISFPLTGVLCSTSKFLTSCHSLCLYSWIQSECFRDFLSKQRWGCDAGYLSALIKVCPICLFSSKLLLSNQPHRWHNCVWFLISVSLFIWALYMQGALYTASKFWNDSFFDQWMS